jgi:hypothetical protein
MAQPDDEFRDKHVRRNYIRRFEALSETKASQGAWRPTTAQWREWLVLAVNATWQQSVVQKKLTFDGFVKAALKQTRSTKMRLHKYDIILVDEVPSM